jgi:hypothetical protein
METAVQHDQTEQRIEVSSTGTGSNCSTTEDTIPDIPGFSHWQYAQ